MVPKRISNVLINALKGGVVPRVGLEYITVGRKLEIESILNDLEIIKDGGATFRFIVGKYGSGKSFLLQTIRNYATSKGFVVMDCDLSWDRRFTGTKGQGLNTYKELIINMSVKSLPDGNSLSLIIEKWIQQIQSEISLKINYQDPSFNNEVSKKIFESTKSLEGLINGFEFAKAINMYYEALINSDEVLKSKILKWFRGEYNSKKEAKDELGINFIVSDENWYDFIKVLSTFVVNCGYHGILIVIDELVNIFKIPNSISRQYNYEKLLTMYNDTLQGKAKNIGFLMGATPQSIEDKYKGVFSYEALRSRLQKGHFSDESLIDYASPIIKLSMLTYDEVFVLIEKIKIIHSELYNYQVSLTDEDLIYFLKVEYNRVGSNTHITPREIIRDFIELLNIIMQNKEKSIKEILSSNSFQLAKGGLSEEDVHKDFSEFDI